MMKLLLATVVVLGVGYVLARAYRLGDYAVETWQDQFDSGNNYFTIQAYCVDSYDPVKNTTNYRYKYLSQNDRKFKDKVKSAKKNMKKG